MMISWINMVDTGWFQAATARGCVNPDGFNTSKPWPDANYSRLMGAECWYRNNDQATVFFGIWPSSLPVLLTSADVARDDIDFKPWGASRVQFTHKTLRTLQVN